MLKLKIISPERIIFTGEVDSVVVPGTLGEFEILSNHAPIISSLEKGTTRFLTYKGEKTAIDILGGFIEVQKNEVSMCVEI